MNENRKMNKMLAASMKEALEEFKLARKTRDKTLLNETSKVLRAMAYANTAKDSHRSRFNNNSNRVTVKNVTNFEDENTEEWVNKN